MMSLRDVQTRFMEAVFGDADSGIAPHLTATGRMDVYRNNIYAALTKALKSIYPVICRLVGEDFFNYAVRHYIDRYPSASGDLNEYGAHFSEFLQTFQPAAGLVYLPDTARLEWYCHCAYLATDDTPLDRRKLAAVQPQRYGALRFRMSSSASLLHSPWPVADIWRVNQDGYAGDQAVNLDRGGVSLLIQRNDQTVALHPLTGAEQSFLWAIQEGLALEAVIDRVALSDPFADISALVQKFVSQQTLVEFSLAS